MLEWYQLLAIFAAVFTGLGSIICVILWYIVRNTIADLRTVEAELSNHRLHVSENYAKSADVKESYEKLCRYLDEVRDAINRMAVAVAKDGNNNK